MSVRARRCDRIDAQTAVRGHGSASSPAPATTVAAAVRIRGSGGQPRTVKPATPVPRARAPTQPAATPIASGMAVCRSTSAKTARSGRRGPCGCSSRGGDPRRRTTWPRTRPRSRSGARWCRTPRKESPDADARRVIDDQIPIPRCALARWGVQTSKSPRDTDPDRGCRRRARYFSLGARPASTFAVKLCPSRSASISP